MKNPPRILIVEDERIVAFNLQQRLAHLGYEVPGVAVSGPESLDMIERLAPDLVLMDIHIEGEMDGIDVASRLADPPSVPVIYLTAYSEDATLKRARQTKPYGYLIKPFSERELHATIQMALERHAAEAAVVRHQRLLQQALDAASLGVLEINTRTREINASDRAQAVFGWSPQHKATLSDLLDCMAVCDRQAFSATIEQSLNELKTISDEFRVHINGQSERWIRIEARHWPMNQMTGVIQDITDRKHSELRLKRLNEGLEHLVNERTAELNQSIKELEAFSSSVAHDLRAPLRAIVGFSQEIMLEHPDDLGEDGLAMVRRIASAGQRMSALIDALLNMSRMTQVPLQLGKVNISDIASEVAQQLMRDDPQRVADVRIAPGLDALADLSLVCSVIDNLLRNAWKFTAQNPVTRIEVGSSEREGEVIYHVRDNGCGFDMAFAHRLFGPFQRLHREQDYAGTGLGLTIVQRVVMRHGGRVWAESTPGQGATFYFTLSG